jgi:hypothetical protein
MRSSVSEARKPAVPANGAPAATTASPWRMRSVDLIVLACLISTLAPIAIHLLPSRLQVRQQFGVI